MGGISHHMVKKFEDMKDGNTAWKSMCEWNDGYVINNETAESHRLNLERYLLTPSSNASNYINNSLTTYRELKKIPGKSISNSHMLLNY